MQGVGRMVDRLVADVLHDRIRRSLAARQVKPRCYSKLGYWIMMVPLFSVAGLQVQGQGEARGQAAHRCLSLHW